MQYKSVAEIDIDNLIETGWIILNGGFGEAEFEKWRAAALRCLTLVCGPDHAYTVYFRSRICGDGVQNVLAGVGLLEAAVRHQGN